MEQLVWLIPLGFTVGAFGTLIGAGGGFILVPVLLMIYPEKSPDTITSISMAVVFFNALSGSSAYARMKRIDYKSGLMFAVATIPGSILGAVTTSYIPRRLFDAVFGILMVAVSAFLLFNPKKEAGCATDADKLPKGHILRSFTDIEGIQHVFSYNPVIGIVLSIFVGYFSSLLGIGGGVIHVPAMIHLLDFPVHIATATSHFILAVMAFTSSMVHLINGTLLPGIFQTFALSIGVLFGAQLGAKLSKRMHGVFIVRGLAVALCLAGVRIFLMALLK